jgi:predicted dehydrogenase
MIRIALVGYGYAGRTFHAPLIEAVDGLSLCAIVSGDRDKVHGDRPAVPVVSLAALAADVTVDAAVVAVPNAVHSEIAHTLLNAGKHVVVDKPFTVSVAEADALEAAASRYQRIVTVFHNRRWDADFLTVRALLEQHALGRIVQFESRAERYRPVVRDRWRERAGPGSGIWFDLGAHLVDQVLQLFGEPDSLFADLGCQRGSGATDFFHVLLRYGDARIVLRGSSLAVAGGPRFHVFGNEASYVKYGWDTQEDALRAGERPGISPAWGDDRQSGVMTRMHDDSPQRVDVPNLRGDYRVFYVLLRDAIAGGAAPPVRTSEAVAVMRVLEAAVTSAERGHQVACHTSKI